MQHGDPTNSAAVFTNLPIYRGILGIPLFAELSLMSLPALPQTSRTLAVCAAGRCWATPQAAGHCQSATTPFYVLNNFIHGEYCHSDFYGYKYTSHWLPCMHRLSLHLDRKKEGPSWPRGPTNFERGRYVLARQLFPIVKEYIHCNYCCPRLEAHLASSRA